MLFVFSSINKKIRIGKILVNILILQRKKNHKQFKFLHSLDTRNLWKKVQKKCKKKIIQNNLKRDIYTLQTRHDYIFFKIFKKVYLNQLEDTFE